MLENTHFGGDPPDLDLVYRIRRFAVNGLSIVGVLDLITGKYDRGAFIISSYLRLCFGVPIHLCKKFGARISHTTSNDELADDDVAKLVLAEIEKTRPIWSTKLGPE